MTPMAQNAMFLATDGSQVCCGHEIDPESFNMVAFLKFTAVFYAWQLRKGCGDELGYDSPLQNDAAI